MHYLIDESSVAGRWFIRFESDPDERRVEGIQCDGLADLRREVRRLRQGGSLRLMYGPVMRPLKRLPSNGCRHHSEFQR